MKNLLYTVIFAGLVFGFFVPQSEIVLPAVPYFIGLMLFLNFLDLEPEPGKLFRKELLVTVPLSALVMPVLVYYVLAAGMSAEYRIGLLLTAIAPSGILMLVLARFVKEKDYNLIISNFFATQFGLILYMPVILEWIVGTSVNISSLQIFYQVASLILIPYFLSLAAKKFMYINFAADAKKNSVYIIPILVFLIISSTVSGATKDIVWDSSLIGVALVALSIFLIHGGIAYFAGYLFGGKEIRNTMLLIASAKNIQLVLGIAVINFPPLVLIPMVLGIIMHHITNGFWLWLLRDK